ncbi:MAG: hypothetical protein J6L91_02715 [Clostridia bacterium]|nr:hypothetical protein [Clostridia bacterium]
MKKVVAILLVAVCLVGAMLGYAVVSVNEKGVAVANFVYADKNVSEEISKEDLETIDKIFSGKIINPFVLPACGFDDNISIVADGKTFCPANDDCAIVYYKEKDILISVRMSRLSSEHCLKNTDLSFLVFRWHYEIR